MTSTNRNANVYFSVLGAGDSKAEIDKIRQAAEALGEKGKKGAQGVVDGLTALEREANNVERKLQTTGVAGERDLRKLVGAVDLLKQSAIAAFGSLANAPVELQHAVQKGEAEITKANEAIGRLNNAVRDNKAHVEAAANQWAGLSGALEGLGGKTGAFVGKWGLVTAAFDQGWQIGQKLNVMFGTDMTLWDERVEVFGRKAGVIVRDLADIIVASVTVVYDTVTGHLSDAKRDLVELGKDVFKFKNDVSAALTTNEAEWNRYAVATNQGTAATKSAQEGAAKLREEKNKLSQAIRDLVTDLKKENEEINKQKGIVETATLALVDQTSNQAHYQREVSSAAAAVEAQKQKVQELSGQFGETSLVVKGAREEQARLETSLQSAQRKLDDTTAEVNRYEAAQRSAKEAIHQHEEKVKELNIAKGKEELALKKVTDALSGPEGHIKKVSEAAEATRQLQSQTNMANVAFTNATPTIDDFKKVFDGDHGLNAMLGTAKQLLMDIAQQCRAMPGDIGPAAAALHSLGEAADAAAGSTTSPDDPRGMAHK